MRCLRCGKENHVARTCQAKNLFCTYCKTPNHILEVCLRRQRDVKEIKVQCEENEESSSTEFEEPLPIYALHHPDLSPVILPILINDKRIQIELDTGSAATILSNKIFKTIPSGKLNPIAITFRSYNKEVIRPLGETAVKVQHKGTTKTLKLFVVQEDYSSIMGWDWIRQLNILPISNCDANVNNIQIDATVNELLNKYDSLFGSSVKPVKNYNYNISLKNDARPVFKRARPVPFTLLPSVEKELQRLEDEGVISKTTFSEWATPVVPVRKPNGDIRLC
uniref:CCHC-type domain-containing protein n=1 Tax=Rhodnius prolixus TaxID=13249 RepID=T1I2T8_RHOPR